MDVVLLRSCEDTVFIGECVSESFIMGAETDSLTDFNGRRSWFVPATTSAGSKTLGKGGADASGLEGGVEAVCSSASGGFETEAFLGEEVVGGGLEGTDVGAKVGVEAMLVSELDLVVFA